MKTTICAFILILTGTFNSFAQLQPQPTNPPANSYPPLSSDPMQNLSLEVTKISRSVQAFSKGIQELLEKFMVGKGMQLNERQQKLLLGFEILNRAEQRLEILQKFQIELTQKEGEVKTRLGQVEESRQPDNIERSVALVGTTRGEEMRENRRQTLETERRSLQNVLTQIQRNLTQTSDELRQAENFVFNLRRKILPQLEAELSGI